MLKLKLYVIPWLGIITAATVAGAVVSVAHTIQVLNEEQEVAVYSEIEGDFPDLAAGE